MRSWLVIKLLAVAMLGAAFTPVHIPRALAGDPDGNAGQYLEQARKVLRLANMMIAKGIGRDDVCQCNDLTSTDPMCLSLRGMTADQTLLCKEIVLKTADRVVELSTNRMRVPLVVSDDPIFVPDPYGNPMEVSAATTLGPIGDVLASYDRVLTMSPMELLSLLGHEFHHKVSYPTNGTYITDNDPIGAFNVPGGGRKLLDSIGAAIAWFSYTHGLIGGTNQVTDYYNCEIMEATSGLDFDAMGGSSRVLSDKGTTYDSSIGNWPSDFSCSIGAAANEQLLYRVMIHEESNCAASGTATRWTTLQLWRSEDPAVATDPAILTLLSERRIAGWNPICTPAAQTPMTVQFAEEGKSYTFTVEYIDTTSD